MSDPEAPTPQDIGDRIWHDVRKRLEAEGTVLRDLYAARLELSARTFGALLARKIAGERSDDLEEDLRCVAAEIGNWEHAALIRGRSVIEDVARETLNDAIDGLGVLLGIGGAAVLRAILPSVGDSR